MKAEPIKFDFKSKFRIFYKIERVLDEAMANDEGDRNAVDENNIVMRMGEEAKIVNITTMKFIAG